MIAPKQLSSEYKAWNKQYKAPFGSWWWAKYVYGSHIGGQGSGRWQKAIGRLWNARFLLPAWLIRRIGCFGFQGNCPSRAFEYPWCYDAASLKAGMKVLDFGGGGAGFQFLLASQGIEVINIDPMAFEKHGTWMYSEAQFDSLNEAFGGRVTLVKNDLENADCKEESFDRIFSISTFEHLPEERVILLAKKMARLLKRDGLLIATIDLFLDCQPFTAQASNRYGTNISVKRFIEASGLKLVFGKTSELHGYEDFNPAAVREDLERFAVHYVPEGVMTQCIVLAK